MRGTLGWQLSSTEGCTHWYYNTSLQRAFKPTPPIHSASTLGWLTPPLRAEHRNKKKIHPMFHRDHSHFLMSYPVVHFLERHDGSGWWKMYFLSGSENVSCGINDVTERIKITLTLLHYVFSSLSVSIKCQTATKCNFKLLAISVI